MELTRRDLLRSGAALAGAVSLGSTGPLRPAPAWAAPGLVAPAGTTLERTLLRGTPGAGGYARVVHGPGEQHTVRTDLGVPAGRKRAARRRPLLAFAHLTDVHVVDVQSPMRLEYFDRYDDNAVGPGIASSAYRPQEMLTAHIAEAMVRAVNRVGVGPVTGAPLALALQTGDNSDSSQLNETRWNIDLLDGSEVRPDSGDPTRFEGVADDDPTWYDTHYWHPGTPVDEVRALLLQHPQVVAMVDGHTHRNETWAHRREDGSPGGFWEINTASHIDWPQQSRLIEIADNRDGTLSVFATMLDHDGPAAYGGRTSDPRALAGLARELAANDWQERESGGRGTVEARNEELLVTAPPVLAG